MPKAPKLKSCFDCKFQSDHPHGFRNSETYCENDFLYFVSSRRFPVLVSEGLARTCPLYKKRRKGKAK